MEELDNTYQTELRIRNMMIEKGNFNKDERLKIVWATEKLEALKKVSSEKLKEMGRIIFQRNSTENKARMEWINEYLSSKGIDETIFTDPNNYNISCEDYDYYCTPKTPYQYKMDEEARKAKRNPSLNKKAEDPESPDVPE